MKSKRGMLLAEETLKTIIAALAIGFLIYFLVSLYFTNQNSNNQKQAQATLDKIKEFLDSSKSEIVLQGVQPGGWSFFSFTGEIKPNSCIGGNCLCVCSEVLKYGYTSIWNSREERQAGECTDNGKCLKISSLKPFDKIDIKDSREGLTDIKVIKKEGGVVIEA